MNHLVQTLAIWQREIEILDQSCELRWHPYFWSSDDHRAPVGGKLLAYIPQPADNHGIIHMTVKILEDEHRLDRHRLHICQRLHGLARVVHRGARSRPRNGVHHRPRQSLRFPAGTEDGTRLRMRSRASGAGSRWACTRAHQPVRDRPFERRHIQFRAGRAHQSDGAHLL